MDDDPRAASNCTAPKHLSASADMLTLKQLAVARLSIVYTNTLLRRFSSPGFILASTEVRFKMVVCAFLMTDSYIMTLNSLWRAPSSPIRPNDVCGYTWLTLHLVYMHAHMEIHSILPCTRWAIQRVAPWPLSTRTVFHHPNFSELLQVNSSMHSLSAPCSVRPWGWTASFSTGSVRLAVL